MVTIYTMKDPDTMEIRYVGKTIEPISRRLHKHMSGQNLRNKSHTCHWLKKLKTEGKKPVIEAVEVVEDDKWQEAEKRWISDLLQQGKLLTNTTPGGDVGSLNYKHTEEAKRKIGELNARPKSKEWQKNAADAMRKVRAKPILQMDMQGNLLQRWESVCYAADSMDDPTRSKRKNITACCRGKRASAYGYKWSYEVVGDSDKEPST